MHVTAFSLGEGGVISRHGVLIGIDVLIWMPYCLYASCAVACCHLFTDYNQIALGPSGQC